MRQKHIGKCHICGIHGELTYEHVPPRGAFNDRPVMLSTLEQAMGKKPGEKMYGKQLQKGWGAYTLCARCNNNTGSWYGNAFIDWAYQGMILKQRSSGTLSMYYPFHIFPLRVIKQIITMFFSTNGDGFREANPYLENFVMDPEMKYLPPRIKAYTYLMTGRASRQTGITAMLQTGAFFNKIVVLSEIAFPPLGYVMTLDSEPPDERLVDITYFSNYSYNDWKTLFINVPTLPVNMYFPGDYRSEKEIEEHFRRNAEDEQRLGRFNEEQ